jgi:hypothetical protein
MMEETIPRNSIWMQIGAFPFALANVMHKVIASISLAV